MAIVGAYYPVSFSLSNRSNGLQRKGEVSFLSRPLSSFSDSNEGEKAVTVPLAPLHIPNEVGGEIRGPPLPIEIKWWNIGGERPTSLNGAPYEK